MFGNNVVLSDPTVDLELVNQCIAAHLAVFSAEHQELKQLQESNQQLNIQLMHAKRSLEKMEALQAAFNEAPSSSHFSALKNCGFFELPDVLFPKEYDDYLKRVIEYNKQCSGLQGRLEQLKEGHEESDVDALYNAIAKKINEHQVIHFKKYANSILLENIQPVSERDHTPIACIALALMDRMKAVDFFKARLRYTLEQYLLEKLPKREKGKTSWLNMLDRLLTIANDPHEVIIPNSKGYPLYEELVRAIEQNHKKENKVKCKLKDLFNFVVMTAPQMGVLDDLKNGMKDILSYDLSHQIKGVVKNYFDVKLDWMNSFFNDIWDRSQYAIDQGGFFKEVEKSSDYQILKAIYDATYYTSKVLTGDEKLRLQKEIRKRFNEEEALICHEFLEQGYSIHMLNMSQQEQVKKVKGLLQNQYNHSQSASEKIKWVFSFWKDCGTNKKEGDLAWMIQGVSTGYQLDYLRQHACEELKRIEAQHRLLEPTRIKRDGFVLRINRNIEARKQDQRGGIDRLSQKLQQQKRDYRNRMEHLQGKDREMLEKLKKQMTVVFKQYQKKNDVGLFEKYYYREKGLEFASKLNESIQGSYSYVMACDILKNYFARVNALEGPIKLRDHSFAYRLLIMLFGDGGIFNKDTYNHGVICELTERTQELPKNDIVTSLQKATTRHHVFFHNAANSCRVAAAQQAVVVAGKLADYFDEAADFCGILS